MTKISRPDMIIFDYGHTLLYEPDWDSIRGDIELFKHISKNPHNVTVDDYDRVIGEVYGKVMEVRENENCDISAQVADRTVSELLNIEFALTPLEREIVFWTAATKGAIMPGADKMLDYLNEKGIRTGVISNLAWSGKALRNRFDRLLPNNKFEFVITSSDYMFRKPSKILFDIALNKAGLPPEKVWYCGDNPKADVEGAAGAGIFPVWYDNDSEYSEYKDRGYMPKCEHLHINEWQEMIDILEQEYLNK